VSHIPDAQDHDEVGRPTPGERLFYALGQLYRRWRTGQSDTRPQEVDIEDMARILGVWGEVEFVQDGEGEDSGQQHFHFPSEVLVVDAGREFPWRLLDAWEWADKQETKDFWRYFH
jgi:hypothetical protein